MPTDPTLQAWGQGAMSQVFSTPHLLLAGLTCTAVSLSFIVDQKRNRVVAAAATVMHLLMILMFSTVVNILCGFVHFLVGPFNRPLSRTLMSSYCQAMWEQCMSVVFPFTKLVLTGESLDDKTQAIIVANHQVDADWWFLWESLRTYGRHGHLKIIMKDQYKNLPILGWGIRAFNFITLKRDWAADKENLKRQLDLFVSDGYPLRLLIFPEGTTINTRTMEKCQEFATKMNRPSFQHLLLPRTTGFQACVDALVRDPKSVDPIVYDVTIGYTGYSGEIPTWEMGYGRSHDQLVPSLGKLLKGITPGPAHVHVRRFLMEDVQKEGEGWLDKIWQEKDKLLSDFIETGHFPGPAKEVKLQPAITTFLIVAVIPVVLFWVTKAAVSAVYHKLA